MWLLALVQFFPGFTLANTGCMTSWSCELYWPMKGLEVCPPNLFGQIMVGLKKWAKSTWQQKMSAKYI